VLDEANQKVSPGPERQHLAKGAAAAKTPGLMYSVEGSTSSIIKNSPGPRTLDSLRDAQEGDGDALEVSANGPPSDEIQADDPS
jgi:hypothetical protein